MAEMQFQEEQENKRTHAAAAALAAAFATATAIALRGEKELKKKISRKVKEENMKLPSLNYHSLVSMPE